MTAMDVSNRVSFAFNISFTVLGFLCNFILIKLIFDVKSMNYEYRRLMVQSCLGDLLQLIATGLCQVSVYIAHQHVFVVLDGPAHYLPPPGGLILLVFWIFTVAYSVMSTAVITLCRFHILSATSKFSFAKQLAYSLVAVGGAFYCAIVVLVQHLTNDKSHLDDWTRLSGGTFVYGTNLFLVDFKLFDSVATTFLLPMFLIPVASYVVMLAANVGVFRHIRKYAATVSRTTHDWQRQLNRMLVTQAVVPFISFFPSLVVCVTVMFCNCFMGSALNVVLALLTLIPVMNPISTIFFIKCYRRRFVLYVQRWLSKPKFITTQVPSARGPTNTPS